jgi:hypothetical protein
MLRYRLDDLGWFQFEWLCQSLLKIKFGIAIESWGNHSDLGREAYYDGPLVLDSAGESVLGPHVFQAKFVQEANAAGAKPFPALTKAISSECNALKTRYSSRKVNDIHNYVLMTNVSLTASMRRKNASLLGSVLNNCRIFQFGGSDLCDYLDDLPHIRSAFPQLLGLRDLNELLSRVVSKAVLERSTLEKRRAAELAQVFTPTSAYNDALVSLQRHHFVVLTGPPEMGKTIIARIIGLAKLAECWECYECRKPKDLFDTFDKSARQVFIADDAFGSTEYRPDLALPWADELDRILRLLDKDHWLLWTSRPAPLHIALRQIELKDLAGSFPQPGEITVDAGRLTQKEKALILYKHAKAAGLHESAKAAIRRHAHYIVKNQHFTPERIRKLVTSGLPAILAEVPQPLDDALVRDSIKQLLETPTDAMAKSFNNLEKRHKMLLISLLDLQSGQTSLEEVFSTYSRISGESSEAQFENIVSDLNGHFIRGIEQ